MWVQVDMTPEERKYWFTKRYCFKCKKVTSFERCGNCNHFFCREHAEEDGPELGDYGSVISPAYKVCPNC